MCSFPWLRYRVDSPSGGLDFGAVFSVSASKYLSLSLKYRFTQREQNVRLTDYYQSVTSVRKHRFRCAVECSPTGWLQLKTEADYAVNAAASANARNGLLLFQDVAVKVEKWESDNVPKNVITICFMFSNLRGKGTLNFSITSLNQRNRKN